MKLCENIYNQVEAACTDIACRTSIGIQTCEHICSGCYADIYLLGCDDGIFRILKYFKFPTVVDIELKSYSILKQHGAFPLPELILADGMKNYICMEYIKGTPLSSVSAFDEVLSANVSHCLLNCHFIQKTLGPEESLQYWMRCYQGRQMAILARSSELVSRGLLDGTVYDLFKQSVLHLCKVLGDSVQTLSLLHGDYTPWNIMVDMDEKHVVAVLDPYMSCFGDREYDLMMMNKANGIQLKLLEQYQEYVPLSGIFGRKTVYYNSWNELCHFYFSNRKESMDISERAYELKQVI